MAEVCSVPGAKVDVPHVTTPERLSLQLYVAVTCLVQRVGVCYSSVGGRSRRQGYGRDSGRYGVDVDWNCEERGGPTAGRVLSEFKFFGACTVLGEVVQEETGRRWGT